MAWSVAQTYPRRLCAAERKERAGDAAASAALHCRDRHVGMTTAAIDHHTVGRSPAAHGYSPIYRQGELNRCPGCGLASWIIGRSTAECSDCGSALPLQHTGLEGCSLGGLYWDRDMFRHGWHSGPAMRSESRLDAEWERT